MNSRTLVLSAWIAVAFGVFLLFGETRRNWGAWGHWASYTFDYLFALMLIASGAFALRGKRWAHFALTISWALTVALFSYSFAGHLRTLDQPTYGPIPHGRLTIIIGMMDAIAIAGCALSASALFGRARTAHR